MNVLVTGGSGFVGSWIVDALLERGAKVSIFSRNPKEREGVKTYTSLEPIDGITHIIHAAYTANREMGPITSLQELETMDGGTESLLYHAVRWPVEKMLVISSGAVYDPPNRGIFQESSVPIAPRSVYGVGKRVAELRAYLHSSLQGFTVTSARLGAFLGPRLPMNRGFAAADFLEDARAGRKIRVLGDGTPIRTYQYPTDMAEWCLKILLAGKHGEAYNVGGNVHISLGALAEMINRIAGGPGIEILGRPTGILDVYAPEVKKAKYELGLSNMSLEEAINRSLA